MKPILIALLFLTLAVQSFCQQTAVTKDGKTVILNDNGTWQYSIGIEGVKLPDSLLKRYTKSVLAITLQKSKRLPHGFWYDPKKWSLTTTKPTEASEYLFKMKDEDGYCVIVTEKIEIPLESFLEIIPKQLQSRGAESVLIDNQEYRMVNGSKVLYVQFSAKVQGISFIYSAYYFSDENGTTQMLCYTGSKLFPKYKIEFENFLNGFVVTDN